MNHNLSVDEGFLVRISFLFTSGFIFAEGLQNWIRGNIESHPEVVLLILGTYGLAFVLFIMATMNTNTILKVRDLAFVALIFVTISSWYVVTQVEFVGSYQTDALAFAHYSAILYSKGFNPYTQDLQSALSTFAVNPQYFTLTPNGDLVTNLNYPALQFIVLLPVVWLGLHDARIVLYLFELAAIAIIYFWSPKQIRTLALIPIFAGSDLVVNFPAGAVADFLWVLPLVLMVVFMEDVRLSGIMFGLACAIKQTPWLLSPFLLVYYLRSGSGLKTASRLKRTTIFVALTIGTFLVPNIGFIFNNFSAWYNGVVTPAFGNLVVLSQGLSLITLAIGVPLPPTFYLTATLAVAATLLINYYVYYEKLAQAVWAFPAIILWFSYRGLQNYFIFWTPLLVMAAVKLYKQRGTNSAP